MASTPMIQPSSTPNPNKPGLSHVTYFNHLAEKAHEIMYRYRCYPSQGFEYINPAASVVTGYAVEDFYSDSNLLIRLHHREDRSTIKQILDGENVFQPVTVRWIRKDGSIIWISEEIILVNDARGKLVAIEGIARQLPPTSQEVIEQRRRLLDISQSIAANFSLEDVLKHILSSMDDLLMFDRCELNIREDLPTLQTLLHRMNPARISPKLVVGLVSKEDEIGQQVLKTGKPSFINSPNPVDIFHPLNWSIPYESRIVIPLRTKDGIPGVVHISRLGGSPFTEADHDLAQLCMGYISLTIENIHLCKENISHHELFSTLLPVTDNRKRPVHQDEMGEAIGNSALEISGADRVSVFQHENDQRLIHLWSSGLSKSYLENLLRHQASRFETLGLRDPNSKYVKNTADLPEESSIRSFAESEGYKAIALYPLVYGKRIIASIDCYYDEPQDWSSAKRNVLELFAHQAGVAMENARLYEELEDSYLQIVLTLAKALDIRDSYTADHSRRLADWAEATARRLNFTNEEIQIIRWAAMLHDIGKIGIPDSILRKPGPLTDDEWQIMRRHPILGVEIVSPMKKFEPVITLIRSHQEKYDGTGYPDGLRGDEIPLAARILTVVDAYGAMTDERVFRKARTKDEAIAELKRCSGTHFDRRVVDVFNDVISVSM